MQATYKIKYLNGKLLSILWVMFKCNEITCLTETSCFATYKMGLCCLKGKKDTKNIDPEISSTSNGRAMILSKCVICGSKKSRFIKNQEAKALLSKLGVEQSN